MYKGSNNYRKNPGNIKYFIFPSVFYSRRLNPVFILRGGTETGGEGWRGLDREDKVCESDMLDPWSIILSSLIIPNQSMQAYTREFTSFH